MDYQEKLEIIYVISNPCQAKDNLYKIGYHTGGMKKLISRYSTAIPNIMIYFSHNVKSAVKIESAIHKKLDKHRLVENGRTEWFQVDLEKITTTIFRIIRGNVIKDLHEQPVIVEEDIIPLETIIELHEQPIITEDITPLETIIEFRDVVLKPLSGYKIGSKDLFNRYRQWCNESYGNSLGATSVMKWGILLRDNNLFKVTRAKGYKLIHDYS